MPNLITPSSLLRAVEASDRALETLRRNRFDAIREYAGRWAFEDDQVDRPLNFVQRFVATTARVLTGRDPEWTITTDVEQMRGLAEIGTELMARIYREMGIRRTMRLLIKDALFGPHATLKVGLKIGDESVTIDDRDANLGQVYARRIDLDDWGCDPAARWREERRFEFDRYRVSKKRLLESGVYDKGILEKLDVLPVRAGAQQKVEDIAGERTGDRFDLIETIELIDVVFYDDGGARWVATLPAQSGYAGDYLRVRDWTGPEQGPYHYLCFDELPGLPFGVPPVANQREQGDNANDVLVKTIEQVSKTKRVLAVRRGTGREEIESIRDASDGSVQEVDDETAYTMLEFGQVSQALVPIANMLIEFWNSSAGNVDILGGARSRAETATKFAGLQDAAMGQAAAMGDAVDEFHSAIGQSVWWWLATDPRLATSVKYKLEDGDDVPILYDATAREGDFVDYVVRVESRSSLQRSPDAQAAKFAQVMPLAMQSAQLTMATQGAWDTAEFLKACERAMGLKELSRIFKGGPQLATLMAQQQAAMATPMPQAQPNPAGRVRSPGYTARPGPGPSPTAAPAGGMPQPTPSPDGARPAGIGAGAASPMTPAY